MFCRTPTGYQTTGEQQHTQQCNAQSQHCAELSGLRFDPLQHPLQAATAVEMALWLQEMASW
jgi:hypothetical protein